MTGNSTGLSCVRLLAPLMWGSWVERMEDSWGGSQQEHVNSGPGLSGREPRAAATSSDEHGGHSLRRGGLPVRG